MRCPYNLELPSVEKCQGVKGWLISWGSFGSQRVDTRTTALHGARRWLGEARTQLITTLAELDKLDRKFARLLQEPEPK